MAPLILTNCWLVTQAKQGRDKNVSIFMICGLCSNYWSA